MPKQASLHQRGSDHSCERFITLLRGDKLIIVRRHAL